MAVTKADITNEIAFKTCRPKSEAQRIAESLLEIVKRTLSSGEDVMVSGFGKFSVKNKSSRRARNPATGEMMVLRPRRVITFHPSRVLRGKMNGGSPGAT